MTMYSMVRRTLPRTVAYLLLTAAAVMVAVFHLGYTLLAMLFSYTLISVTGRVMSRWLRPVHAKWLALLVFLMASVLLVWLTGHFARQSLTAVPEILEKALPQLGEQARRYGIKPLADDTDDLRRIVIEAIKDNAHGITQASGILTQKFFYIIIGVFVAILCFMSTDGPGYGPNLYDAVRAELVERVRGLAISFELVLGAQVVIATINTVLTATFLRVLGFPHAGFLILATFIFGIIPVVGNLMSNTIIVCTALTISPRLALLALGFLILIHKGEYFLNGKVVGASIQAPMWQTLLGILVGEVLLGVPGIILAPAVMHYVRHEMQEIPYTCRG